MKLVIASDHGGFSLKQEIIKFLESNNFIIEDLGPYNSDSVDYPDYAGLVAKRVAEGSADRGILVCGTGIGMAIAANKFKGIRAAAINDLLSARLSREHNNLNVLCLGGRVLGTTLAEEIVLTFLKTPFAGGRHEKRVNKIL